MKPLPPPPPPPKIAEHSEADIKAAHKQLVMLCNSKGIAIGREGLVVYCLNRKTMRKALPPFCLGHFG